MFLLTEKVVFSSIHVQDSKSLQQTLVCITSCPSCAQLAVLVVHKSQRHNSDGKSKPTTPAETASLAVVTNSCLLEEYHDGSGDTIHNDYKKRPLKRLLAKPEP